MRTKRNASIKSPPPPAPRPSPSERGGTKHPATRLLKGRSYASSYTSPLTEKFLGTPPPTIDDASPQSANDYHLLVTLPLRERSTGQGSNGNQGDNGTVRSRMSPRVLRPPHGGIDHSSPFVGISRHSKPPASSNSRVASRVSKQPSSIGIESLRRNQRARQRFSIERCLKLVREADSSIHNTRAQRLRIARENTEMLLTDATNYTYVCLSSIEPNLPDITLDGLEAIANDLVHTINERDPSREIRIQGGRLGGQLLDRTLAKGLGGYTMPCGQDAEFDPVIQLPLWHAT